MLAPASRDLAPYEVLEGIPVHRFRYAPRRWETLAYTGTMAETVGTSLAGKLTLAAYMAGQGLAARWLVRRTGATLVHAHWWFPAGLVASLSGLGKPLVVTLHGSDVRLAVGRKRAHSLIRAVLRRAAAVTAVSSWLAEQVRTVVPDVHPLVSPMPVNTRLFHPPADGRSPDSILFVGRLNEQKGLRLLLDALAAMQRRPALDVVGDGPDAKALRDQVLALGIAGRVTWHGALAQPQLVQLYQRAAAVAIPSLEEGLGLVAVEAQLCETPVVAFNSGGLADVISDGETGFLAAPNDVRALATALDRILADAALRQTLGAAGRARALATFSPESAAARYAELYGKVVAHAVA